MEGNWQPQAETNHVANANYSCVAANNCQQQEVAKRPTHPDSQGSGQWGRTAIRTAVNTAFSIMKQGRRDKKAFAMARTNSGLD
jgi:hypothetical protein